MLKSSSRGLPIGSNAIDAARRAIVGWAIPSPVVQLQGGGNPNIFLKLESLQPVGSFKIRGAALAVSQMTNEELLAGPWTASTGNMARALAFVCERLAVNCTVIVPDNAPATKVAAVRRLGAAIIPVPPEQWFEINERRTYPGMSGPFLHPADDERVIAANATIAAEILEEVPDVETILTPWGMGGLTCGVASGVRALGATVQIIATEREDRAPLAASLAAGSPQFLTGPKPTFPDAIGARTILPNMWACAKELVIGAIGVHVSRIAEAVRIMAEENRIVTEGAGATPVAVAIERGKQLGKVVCVVSGGNIDSSILTMILKGGTPR